MADFSMFHALGQQQTDSDNQKIETAPPTFRPPIAPGPAGYQQVGSSQGHPPPQQYNPPTAYAQPGAPPTVSPYQEQGNVPPAPMAGPAPGMESLTQQMGQVGLGTEGAAPTRTQKRRDRHAYHNLEAPGGSSQAFNGIPQGQVPPTSYLNQPITPAMSQFPAAANPVFTPQNQATTAQHAARSSTPLQGSSVSSAQGRVDPEQIPSVARARDVATEYYLSHAYATMERHLPPPAAVPFIAFDQGNASPKFTRLTLNCIPSTQDALAATSLPLGLLVQPLAPLQDGEQAIPVLDFGDAGPPRCRRCRTYINPFMTFPSGGNKFVCNMCLFPNDVTPEYFSPTDPSGVRIDRAQRPELTLGTVEFVVPKEYWGKPPVPLRWLFLIDVCEESVNKGFVDAFCEGIMSALYGPGNSEEGEGETPGRLPPGSKIGIVTFDKEIHFYNLNSALQHAQMMVMTDVEEPFVPFNEGLFVDPEDSKTVITQLLTQLPNMFSGLKNPEPALLSTLNAAMEALSATGGKIVCSIGELPTWGPGRLFFRDDTKMLGVDAEKKLLTTEHASWTKAATKMVEHGIGVDFFMAAPSGGYLDIATIGHVSAKSGGEVYYYPNFHAPRDSLRLAREIKHTVTRETGYQALMKVRCSNGLQVSAYHGNFTHHTFGADLEFGAIDADKAISVMFSYDGKLDPKLDAHFQSALLYTTADGHRRVRCSNIVASVADGSIETMKLVDQEAVVAVMAKEAACRVPDKTLKEIRSSLTEKTIDILASYRKLSSGSHPPGQLILPELMKEFSMYMLGLVKSRALKGGREPTDRRVQDLMLLKQTGAMELSLYLYPRIISLHNLDERDGFANENGHLRMPPTVRASFSRVEEGGAYIVDNGQICLLWLHAQVSPNLLEDLFGPGKTTLKSLDAFQATLPVLDTHLNAQVRNILQYLESTRGSKALTLQLARQGLDGAEYEYARLLYEDRNNEAQNYVDWLVHLHRQISLELSGQRKKEESSVDPLAAMSTSFAGFRPYFG